MKRSKRQIVNEEEPGIIDFKRIRLEADSFSEENGEFAISFFLVHLEIASFRR